MQEFDTLKIQKNIEEKRLVLGQKLENFLLKKLAVISGFFKQVFAAKSCAFLGAFLIILISIFVRSSRDLGHDSAAVLEISGKLLNGGKYYQDFFEYNLPLGPILLTLPHFLARLFSINLFFAAEIFTNLVGIFSLYFSARILSRADFSKDRTVFNLIILSFATGFFLRIFTLQYNEFATKSTFFLAFVFPYISFHLLEEKKLKNSDQVFTGLLAALLFALKPHYGILVIIFECKKLFEKKSLKSGFCLRNYITLFALIFYLLLILKFFPQYLQSISLMSDAYYSHFDWNVLMISLRENLFSIWLLIFLCFQKIRNDKILLQFFYVVLAVSLVILSEILGGFDQKFILYSLALPLLSLLLLSMIRNNEIDFRKNGIFIILILMVTPFDFNNFFTIALNLAVFWWIFVLVLSSKWRKKISPENASIIMPADLASWAHFLSLAAFTIYLSFTKFAEISWIISAAIFVYLLLFYQKNFQEFYHTKKLPLLSVVAIFLVITNFLVMHLSAIFNLKICDPCNRYKTPNFFSEQFIKNSKAYSAADENIISIAQLIPTTYPMMSYAGKKNPLPFLQFPLLFSEISKHQDRTETARQYFISRIKEQLKDKKTKLIYIEILDGAGNNSCQITLLEFLLRDQEFKKIFTKNYKFLNRIIERKIPQKNVAFFSEDQAVELDLAPQIIDRDVEIYIRK